MRGPRLFALLVLVWPHMSLSQPIRHAELLEAATRSDNFSLGRPFHVRPMSDGRTVLFLRSGPRTRKSDIWSYDAETGEERLLLAASELLAGEREAISVEEQARLERARIRTSGFTGFAVAGQRMIAKLSGRLYLYDLGRRHWARLVLPAGTVLDPRLSPDGGRLAFVLDHDLYVAKVPRMTVSGDELKLRVKRLTKGGTAVRPNGLAEFVAQEEMGRMSGYWWRPDGEAVAYQSNDSSGVETFTIADAARPAAEAHQFPYPRPGRKNVEVRLHVIDRKGKKRVEVQWDRVSYPYLARVAWTPKKELSLLVQSRDQRRQTILLADADGLTRSLYEERDEAWLNLKGGTPRWIEDGAAYLYATEEGGAWRLERHELNESRDGLAQKSVLVPQEAGYEELEHIDEKAGYLYFSGGSRPTETHVFRAPLTGGPVEALTHSHGMHGVSLSGRLMVSREVTLAQLPVVRVRTLDEQGQLGPSSALQETAEEPEMLPRVEIVPPEKAGGFNGMIVRPRDFEPGRAYPVIVYVYGGPHALVVQSDCTRYFLQQFLADQGFVVISIDNRGTPRRGRDFERAIKDRFDEVPLEDQVKGLQALASSYPELDVNRVGIYGWSFGGTMATLATLDRPDVYKAGVSGAPVTDWLYYDSHYTERYLGIPTEDEAPYVRANLIRRAAKLTRPLMLIHGIADDNVYFAHSLMLSDALFRNGRAHDFLPLVGLTHQLSDPEVRLTLFRRIVAFFHEHL
ncbi:MAG: DPP IV N-terminal domain-containing protein [Myxococcota bacterium]